MSTYGCALGVDTVHVLFVCMYALYGDVFYYRYICIDIHVIQCHYNIKMPGFWAPLGLYRVPLPDIKYFWCDSGCQCCYYYYCCYWLLSWDIYSHLPCDHLLGHLHPTYARSIARKQKCVRGTGVLAANDTLQFKHNMANYCDNDTKIDTWMPQYTPEPLHGVRSGRSEVKPRIGLYAAGIWVKPR